MQLKYVAKPVNYARELDVLVDGQLQNFSPFVIIMGRYLWLSFREYTVVLAAGFILDI